MMKSMKGLLIVVGVLSSLVCGSAMAKAGPYIGVNIGSGGMDTPELEINQTSSYELRGLAGGIDAGYLWQTQQLEYGVELGFDTYAKNKYRIGDSFYMDYKGYNLDLLGVAKYNFSSQWNVFGKAGLAYVNQKLTVDGLGLSGKNKNEIKPKVSLGFGYDFTPELGMNAEFSHVFAADANSLKSDGTKVASVNMLTLGMQYRF
ncbi:outer membrane protein [Photobacterium damselae]|uniref:outer membrane protein n=1 Tax=Photobacterium damselae TaxID=38293 RepID=UPI001F440CBE|nr:outer membrane beta-barrel protein [Photobacterium damselae]UKA11928.1 porin family protein [Photobacterium damselae subsp. damselae]